jgi:hypothetical protein
VKYPKGIAPQWRREEACRHGLNNRPWLLLLLLLLKSG